MVLSSTSRKSINGSSSSSSSSSNRRKKPLTAARSSRSNRRGRRSQRLGGHEDGGCYDAYAYTNTNTSTSKNRQLHARDLDDTNADADHYDDDRPIYRKKRSSLSYTSAYNPYQEVHNERKSNRTNRLYFYAIMMIAASLILYPVMFHGTTKSANGHGHGHGHGHGSHADHMHANANANTNVNKNTNTNPLAAIPNVSVSRTIRKIIPEQTPEDKIQRFLSWLVNDHGAKISPHVGLASFEEYGGYGLIALDGGDYSGDNNNGGGKNLSEKGTDAETETEMEQENQMDHLNDSDEDDDDDDGTVIHALDEMFTIPKSIIASPKSILDEYNVLTARIRAAKADADAQSSSTSSSSSSSKPPSFARQLATKVQQSFPQSSLKQQDIIIAMHLMVECTLGPLSKYEPYLSILPSRTIPRLDTFQPSELRMLNDVHLTQLSMMQKRSLEQLYNDDVFQSLLDDMVQGAKEKHGLWKGSDSKRFRWGSGSSGSTSTSGSDNSSSSRIEREEHAKCMSYDAFHKYVTIVSSRAMVLHGVKYLTPLAGMANYQPRNRNRNANAEPGDKGSLLSSSSEEDTDMYPYPFTLFHERNRDGSITVRADRNVAPGEQIFEDYGALDNTLYLEAHGFVPDVNPYHCASIPAKYLAIKPSDMKKEHEQHGDGKGKTKTTTTTMTTTNSNSTLADVMVSLRLLPPNPEKWDASLPDLCVMEDGTMDDPMAMTYLSIAALHLPGALVGEQRRKCLHAQNQLAAFKANENDYTYDNDEMVKEKEYMVQLQCVQYKGAKRLRQRLVRTAARRTYCDQTMSWEDDEAMLRSLHDLHDDVSVQMELALKFRVAEKKVLSHLAGDFQFSAKSCDDFINASDVDADADIGMDIESNLVLKPTKSDAEAKRDSMAAVEKFNTFIEEMHLPHHRIKAAYVGGGMRVGVVATEDIKESDIYLAMNSASVINVETAMEKMKDLLPLSKPLAYIDGGADVLMWFIFYEKYVARERSKWFPYLQMLPTVEDMKLANPLYFQDELFDFLAGSDLRVKLIEHKKRVFEKFEKAAEDFNTVRAFGIENFTRDNFMWAYAIVHSRSIWWNGERHLVPLLDLVNCAELRNGQGKPASAHMTTFIEDLAITQATASFKKGEQLFENYAQPNYIYFMYHGFLLEGNSRDCAFLQLGISRSLDKETNERLSRNNLSSATPTFCISDRESLDSLANFIRVKHNLFGNDNMGLQDDVTKFVRDELEYRLKRYEEIGDRFGNKSEFPYSLQSMKKIVQAEKDFLRNALEKVPP